MADILGDRVAAIDWPSVEAALDAQGFAPLPVVLAPEECAALAALYQDDRRFRSRIDMERFRFGVGEYKYFAAPLPEAVQTLRTELYSRLAPTANKWSGRLEPRATHQGKRSASLQASVFPATLDAFLDKCHRAGQRRPTPLLLSYRAGGYNCLHQDI